MNGKNVKIVIATHKKYRMPKDKMYIPIHVGAECRKDKNGNAVELGYIKDNTGDNISKLNSSFCELTALYWAWKNVEADYIGLAHYRRHFSMKRKKDIWKSVLTYKQLVPYLGRIRVFTPNKRRYYIESLYSHYAHTHYAEQLDETRKIILEKYPEYLKAYDKVLKRDYGYMFNMMIMDKKCFEHYCKWLFDILFELKTKIDMPKLSAFQGRFYGRISEIMFNVWLEYQIVNGKSKKKEIKELQCIHMEKINWLKKGGAFLKAKFLHERYEGSF